MKIQEKIDRFFKQTDTCPSDWHVSNFQYGSPEKLIDTSSEFDLYINNDEEKLKCDLCETKIIHEFFINHNGKKISARVGSECIKKFLVGTNKSDFTKNLKKITLKESNRKLKIRIYNTLTSSLCDLFCSFEKVLLLEHKMPIVNEEWHYLVAALEDAKLSRCKNYASVKYFNTLKDLEISIKNAKKEPFFDDVVKPEEWWASAFSIKPNIDLDYLVPEIINTIKYCKTTDNPVKVFASCYFYRFSKSRKSCPSI
jgi:hypothetical protein